MCIRDRTYAGAQDRRHQLKTLEERRTLRSYETENASSLRASRQTHGDHDRGRSFATEALRSRVSIQIGSSTPCASAPSLRYHAMPPRTTEESHRPRASDRTIWLP